MKEQNQELEDQVALAYNTLEVANEDHEYLRKMHEEMYQFAEKNKLMDQEKEEKYTQNLDNLDLMLPDKIVLKKKKIENTFLRKSMG